MTWDAMAIQLSDARLHIERDLEVPASAVVATPRIGIDYADPVHRQHLWRFHIRDNPWVSRK